MSKMSGWDKIQHLPADDPRRVNARKFSRENLARKGGRKRTPAEQRWHSRAQQLRRNFGLTVSDYEKKFEEQGGVCAICQQPEYRLKSKGSTPKRLAVDHCHKTQQNRGLLCHDCNIALGLFRDDPLRLAAAIAYLKKCFQN